MSVPKCFISAKVFASIRVSCANAIYSLSLTQHHHIDSTPLTTTMARTIPAVVPGLYYDRYRSFPEAMRHRIRRDFHDWNGTFNVLRFNSEIPLSTIYQLVSFLRVYPVIWASIYSRSRPVEARLICWFLVNTPDLSVASPCSIGARCINK